MPAPCWICGGDHSTEVCPAMPDDVDDDHLEAAYEECFEGPEDYESNPYDGTYSEE